MHICHNCQKDLWKKPKESPSHYSVRKFCDRSCAASFNNKATPKRKKSDSEGKITREKAPFKTQVCNCCKTDFQVRLTLDGSQYIKRKFCDVCVRVKRLESRNFNVSKIENRTKGELFATRKNWQSARTAIRNHANIVLQTSNQKPECKVCGYTKHVEVCHIKSVSEFTDDALIGEINDLNNLVYLCPNHHWEFDNDNLDIG